MGRYAAQMNRTASATLDVGSLITAAASPRRFALYDIIVGSEATPADNAFLWTIVRKTGAATGGTAVTPVALDFSDTIASTLVGNEAPTGNGAGTDVVAAIPLNQRATFRWVAAPGGELVSSNAASNGYAAATPTAGGLVAVTATFHADER